MLGQLNCVALHGCSYYLHAFGSADHAGNSVFHTDLLLGFTQSEASVCKDCSLPEDYPGLQQALKDEGFVMKEITYEQLNAFF
jgi:hypothetical protein